eukprot:9428824-Pyramimonas_sp.AAC.1
MACPMLAPEAFLDGVQVMITILIIILWWLILQQVTGAHPTVERVERGHAFRKPKRNISSVKWLVPSGSGDPLRAFALVFPFR